ncbi:MAG: MoaD/ThiS family protein [Candidatus Carbobacillus altaicus]|uniref:Molybdopterin synthase sulfur carrier subunit n=1 Tax=Candidatus Carbonibacillus altaicus TaxID=2163959 RepID=A0A2R6Y2X0_9BACL|nr:MoaD/ThiS family protein [Candidatus Carbobacillus altaicus]PTQ57029.1 MAG: Molybdenum cofactor biosynthesis protein MoaD [Candidatus Carbobacillus altaicus]
MESIQVLFFAGLRERFGDRHQVAWEEGLTVEGLLNRLHETYPDLAPFLKGTMIAVNEAYAARDTSLHPGDQVAIIPPVSGG